MGAGLLPRDWRKPEARGGTRRDAGPAEAGLRGRTQAPPGLVGVWRPEYALEWEKEAVPVRHGHI